MYRENVRNFYVKKKKERERKNRTNEPMFSIIPCISIAVDSTSSVAVQVDIDTAENEASCVVLEGDWI
jgi:hypothetical protein